MLSMRIVTSQGSIGMRAVGRIDGRDRVEWLVIVSAEDCQYYVCYRCRWGSVRRAVPLDSLRRILLSICRNLPVGYYVQCAGFLRWITDEPMGGLATRMVVEVVVVRIKHEAIALFT